MLEADFHHLARHFAADIADLALQVADAGLARVVADDLQNRVVGEDHVFLAQSGLRALLLYQVLAGNFQLLRFGVALQPENLHAVLERGRNGVHDVRRGHKQHLRQVIVHIEIVVLECGVLLRVKHFQKCRRRVAPEVRSHLVHFVEQEDRVLGSRALHMLDNLAG